MLYCGTTNDELTNKRLIFRRMDNSKDAPMLYVKNIKDAQNFNEHGCGIFWTVNGFNPDSIHESGRGRSIENVTSIFSWAMECDKDDLVTQQRKIKTLGIKPSLIIRSKRSYQVYWNAKNGTKENYKTISSMLCELLNGDKAVTHPAVVLRAPWYSHMKDPTKPFTCKIIFEDNCTWDEEQIIKLLKAKLREAGVRTKREKEINDYVGSNHNQKEILEKLSGAVELNGDVIKFKRSTNGKTNIIINDASCEAWLDDKGMIGSRNGGGPTALQWIMYYGYSRSEALEILRRYVNDGRI